MLDKLVAGTPINAVDAPLPADFTERLDAVPDAARFVTYCLCGTGVEELLRAAEALLARAGADLAACPSYREEGS